jgi:hypothetical protein
MTEDAHDTPTPDITQSTSVEDVLDDKERDRIDRARDADLDDQDDPGVDEDGSGEA